MIHFSTNEHEHDIYCIATDKKTTFLYWRWFRNLIHLVWAAYCDNLTQEDLSDFCLCHCVSYSLINLLNMDFKKWHLLISWVFCFTWWIFYTFSRKIQFFFNGDNESYSQTNECDFGELAPTLVFDAIITCDIQTLSHLPPSIQRLWSLELNRIGKTPSSTPCSLGRFGQLTSPLWAPHLSWVK